MEENKWTVVTKTPELVRKKMFETAQGALEYIQYLEKVSPEEAAFSRRIAPRGYRNENNA